MTKQLPPLRFRTDGHSVLKYGGNDRGQEARVCVAATPELAKQIALTLSTAPQLLEALKAIVLTADSGEETGHTEAETVAGNWDVLGPRARAAIKAARGES